MKRLPSLSFVLVSAVGLLVLGSSPAQAACHRAVFSPQSYSVVENEGKVALEVILEVGQPHCSGTVDYATEPGTAQAGQDYTHTQGKLTFNVGDDREEVITISILNDSDFEGNETFQVNLSTGGRQQTIRETGPPATVTITNDDTAPPTSSSTPSPSPSPTESPLDSPSPTVTPSPPLTGGIDARRGGLSGPVIAAIAAAVAAAAGGGLWWLRKRGAS